MVSGWFGVHDRVVFHVVMEYTNGSTLIETATSAVTGVNSSVVCYLYLSVLPLPSDMPSVVQISMIHTQVDLQAADGSHLCGPIK